MERQPHLIVDAPGAAEIERDWIEACQIEALAGDLRDALRRLGEFQAESGCDLEQLAVGVQDLLEEGAI